MGIENTTVHWEICHGLKKEEKNKVNFSRQFSNVIDFMDLVIKCG